jgi:hypothetical protein
VAAAKERQREAGGDRKSADYQESVSANLREPVDTTVVAFPGKAAASAAKSVLWVISCGKQIQSIQWDFGLMVRQDRRQDPGNVRHKFSGHNNSKGKYGR